MHYSLKQICSPVGGKLHGQDVTFVGVSTDSRQINPGELFVALVGEKFDGHDFIAQARERGAVAALTSKPVETQLSTVQVTDTLYALGRLAGWHRSHFTLPVIGLTGSCGKTTVKTMIASILNEVAPTLSSIGNLNNAIGLPLSLLKLNAEHRYAVLEMGANHIGEIAYLCDIAKPTVSLITCVRPVHVEGFGGIDNIAKAKGEIYSGLAENGVAIINHDEPYSAEWHAQLPTQSIVTFGLQGGRVTAKNIHRNAEGGMSFTLCMADEQFPVALHLLGEHNVLNALAAAATTSALGVPLSAIQMGLTHMAPVKGRLVQRRGYQHSLLLDDHYNSNPAALEAAISILATYPGRKIMVMGDMLELGSAAKEIHEQVAHWLANSGIEYLFGFGELTRHTVKAFGDKGQHFSTHEDLAIALKPLLSAETTVLIKGSRGMKMENVVAQLLES